MVGLLVSPCLRSRGFCWYDWFFHGLLRRVVEEQLPAHAAIPCVVNARAGRARRLGRRGRRPFPRRARQSRCRLRARVARRDGPVVRRAEGSRRRHLVRGRAAHDGRAWCQLLVRRRRRCLCGGALRRAPVVHGALPAGGARVRRGAPSPRAARASGLRPFPHPARARARGRLGTRTQPTPQRPRSPIPQKSANRPAPAAICTHTSQHNQQHHHHHRQ